MQIVRTFEELAAVAHDLFLAIGVFDGVHLGHQRVIGAAVADARAAGGRAVVLTFDPHPVRVLHPDKAPPLLTSTAHKLRLIEALGADVCLLLRFDNQFAATTAEQFLETLHQQTNHLREICVGTRFRFGHDRAGDIRLIESFAQKHGFAAKEIHSVKLGDEIISSTSVRAHVLHGRLDRAAAMLGRPFSVFGTVQRGAGLGRQLGFPTANVNPHHEAFPPDGVYVAQTIFAGRTFGSILNLGRRPTVDQRGGNRLLEVHLLDFSGDLYGAEIEVVFLQKLRDEQKFAAVAELQAQIAADVRAARASLRF